MGDIDHQLPCGHVVATSALLDGINRFASQHLRGVVQCPVCDDTAYVEFARLAASDGSQELSATFVATGRMVGTDFKPHQRRHVRELVVDGSVARMRDREWQLPN